MAGVFDRLEAVAEEILAKLDDLIGAMGKLDEIGSGGSGGGGGGGGGPGGGGGFLPTKGGKAGGLAGKLGKLKGFARGGLVGVAAGAVALAGKTAADGALGASRGGDFGASAAASLNRAAAAIPIVGELGGFSALNRVTKGVEGDLNSTTNAIARYGGSGAIRPEVRKILASEFSRQNNNVELDRQQNSAASEAVLTQSARGLGAGAEGMASIGTQINSFLTFIGLNQHQ